MSQVVCLSFFRFDTVAARLWAFAMMGMARGQMRRLDRVEFWKLCGSGVGEGFAPIPNTSVYAILTAWPNMDAARTGIEQAQIFNRYRTKAAESWTVYLSTESVRGAWSGQTPFIVSNSPEKGPLAALTRATIKPSILGRFWGRVPDISSVIGKDPNVLFKIGIGEVPWLHQVTFSIWPDAVKMAQFARTGHHAEAIKAVRDEGWFREELYARFHVIGDHGSWNGASPLKAMERA